MLVMVAFFSFVLKAVIHNEKIEDKERFDFYVCILNNKDLVRNPLIVVKLEDYCEMSFDILKRLQSMLKYFQLHKICIVDCVFFKCFVRAKQDFSM